jgi:hypothetical protein
VHLSALDTNADAQSDFTIAISDLRTGPTSDLLATPEREIATPRAGRVLETAIVSWTVSSERSKPVFANVANLRWVDAENSSQRSTQPLYDRILGPGEYTRYVRMTVSMTFEGRQRQYAAVFLFGPRPGFPPVLAIDDVVGSVQLNSLIGSFILPGPLLLSGQRNRAAVRAFLESARGRTTCVPEPVTGLCCDAASASCGISPLLLGPADAAGSR